MNVGVYGPVERSTISLPISETPMLECLECGAPASVVGGHEATGVDFDGTDAFFWVDMIQCAAGCRYELVNDERTVRL